MSPLLPVAILAGGLATRLRPLTEQLPKALIELEGEPFVAHQLRLLRARGVDRVVLCVGYRGEMVRECVGDGSRFGIRIDFSFDGSRLLGTAGALVQALPMLGQQFFVLYGDSYLPCDYAAVQATFEQQGRLGLMVVYRNDGQWDRSNVEFADHRIVAYDKRTPSPRMRYIDYGLSVLDRRALESVPRAQPYDLADVYQDLLGRHELAALEVTQRFYEIGSLEGLADTQRHLAHQTSVGI